MKYWEINAAKLGKAGWSLGYVSYLNAQDETVFCVDAQRGDGKRYIVHSDQLLTAFSELEQETRKVALTAPLIQVSREFHS